METAGFVARRLGWRLADLAVANPLVRWTWTSMADSAFSPLLAEFRPIDADAISEMMAGRYVLAARLVDTEGLSPFAHGEADPLWRASLQSFAWLRHFSAARDGGERRFALMLVLDWIGRHGRFSRESWGVGVTAQRVLNWLRHYEVIRAGASAEQERSIARSLRTQIQSLRLRGPFAADPREKLLAEIALAGVALCDGSPPEAAEAAVARLAARLGEDVDETGMHRSRNPRAQVQLLIELTSLTLSLKRHLPDLARLLTPATDAMHRALDAVTLGTGEPAYFNGSGQMAHDILIALKAQSTARSAGSALVGGYGVLRAGRSTVVADSGLAPPLAFARGAHAGALGIEFSDGTELVLGSCGPAPAGAGETLFAEGRAHSAPTVDGASADAVGRGGVLRQRGVAPQMHLERADNLLILKTNGYASRFGVVLERRLTLLAEGKTLVGQDVMLPAGGRASPSGVLAVRFHLAPGAAVRRGGGDRLVRIVLSGGAVWSLLWEGAELAEDESVRQSAYFGLHRTRQLVLTAPVAPGQEIAWVMTREDG